MTYACLTVSNSVGMCTQTTLTSNSLFLEFNLSQDYKLPSLINGTNDCSCRITTENCHAKLNMTVVDLRLEKAFNLSSLTSYCSHSYLQAVKSNKTLRCSEPYNSSRIERMKSITIPSSIEIISLRNLYQSGSSDSPSFVLLSFQAIPDGPVTVKCFAPGIKASNNDPQCLTTTVFPQSRTTIAPPSVTTLSSSTHKTTSTYSTPSTQGIRQTSGTTTTNTDSVGQRTTVFGHSTTDFEHHNTQLTMIPSKIAPSAAISSSPFSSPAITPSSPISPKSSLTTPSNIFTSDITMTGIPHTYSKPHIEQTSDSALTNTSTIQTFTSAIPSFTARVSDKDNSLKIILSTNTLQTSTSSASSDMSSESRSTHFVSTNGADETTTIVTKDTNGGNKEGLIIGITVAVVLIILILVAIAMLCLCVRIKRKEAVRRDSIRNTNIFYSFPQDLEDTESIQSSNAVSTPREATMFPADLFQPDPGTNKAPKESTVGRLQFESYTKEHVTKDLGIYSESNGEFSRMPNDSFASETSEETIAFDNETVHIMPENGDVKTSMNGVKSVSFDQNALYAKVIKEGKTKL
ncbi:serine-rich adhesin for platelets-like [Mya arenaria]|uniref:serine-rich adhesin for platelets-like n=1 Tax=Mya arenaria TaxID=6604 RepID=UPI0022E1D639|nr:serine-rich adhesin for platelets-like [Mya arenaria]